MEKMWFYAQGTNRQGPMPESEIKSLIALGQLSVTDLAWTEGMTDWSEIAAIPELHARALSTAPETTAPPAMPAVVENHQGLPDGLLNWMGFVGAINITSGILSCLTCIGAVTGIFLIIAGAALLGARSALVAVHTVDPALHPFFEKLKSFMLMNGIVFIVGIVAWILVIVFFMTAAVSGASGGLHH